MNKAHYMSQTKITIPITVKHIESPVRLEPVSLREWLRSPDAAPQRFVWETRKPNGPFDPWQLREDFLSWPVEGWESFISMTGAFGTFRISQKDFVEWKSILKEALVRPASEWRKIGVRFDPRKVDKLFAPLPITFKWDEKTPLAIVWKRKSLDAIIATIQLDKLQGSSFKICARTDCKNAPFKAETRHKMYCSPECAHLVAVRNSRAREAKRKKSKR
jgi:hypothetical protein